MTRLDSLIRRFNQQAAEAKPDGYVLQGSVVHRYFHRSVGGATKDYGPYYVWTRKIHKKTVTQALTTVQAEIITQAIWRNRQLEKCLGRLRRLSEQIILALTPSVTKRNRPK